MDQSNLTLSRYRGRWTDWANIAAVSSGVGRERRRDFIAVMIEGLEPRVVIFVSLRLLLGGPG